MCLTLVVRTAAGLIWNYIDIVQIRPAVISLRIDPDQSQVHTSFYDGYNLSEIRGPTWAFGIWGNASWWSNAKRKRERVLWKCERGRIGAKGYNSHDSEAVN